MIAALIDPPTPTPEAERFNPSAPPFHVNYGLFFAATHLDGIFAMSNLFMVFGFVASVWDVSFAASLRHSYMASTILNLRILPVYLMSFLVSRAMILVFSWRHAPS